MLASFPNLVMLLTTALATVALSTLSDTAKVSVRFVRFTTSG